MARHFEHLKFRAQEISGRCFFNEKIGLGRFDLEFESEIAKKILVRDHRRRFGVTSDLAIEAALDRGHVLDVIDMPMREQKKF